MEHRYSLRFETGERRGETIGIPATGLTVGRKPGNTLQVLDNSVSGNHAVFEVGTDGVLLRDLGSTNGSRVGTQRVLEHRLAPGDTILIGNVRFTFRDDRATAAAASAPAGDGIELEGFDEPAPAPSPLTATTVTPGAEGLSRVSAEHIAESKKRSFTGVIAVVVLAAVGGGLWYWFNHASGSSGPGAAATVTAVPDNLIGGYSFEGEDESWTNADGTPAGFVRSGASKHSGAFGVEADLEAGQWALYRSRPVRASSGRILAARAALRAKGAASGRLGIEFTNPPAEGVPSVGSAFAWSAAVSEGAQFQGVELQTVVPAGFSQVRVVILARSAAGATDAGQIEADDACLVPVAGEGKSVGAISNAELYLLGESASTLQLAKAERALVTGLAFTPANDPSGLDALPATARVEGPRFAVEPQGKAASLVLRAEEPLARARVATIGEDGYRVHAVDFERTKVAAILLGNGADMVRIQLADPASVRAVAEGAATRIVVTPASAVLMQLDFAAERKQAGNVAYAARGAEQRGELGPAVAQWTTLLNDFPFEDALVSEAETARTRLVQKGLEELRVVEADVERARFFRLADIFKKCRDNALALAKRYEQSEVETRARELALKLALEIGTLEVDVHRAERTRMRSILATLEAQGATTLAAEVRRYLTDKLGDKPGDKN